MSMSQRHPLLHPVAAVLCASLCGMAALPAGAAGNDPFSTQGKVAPSPAGSVKRPAEEPCQGVRPDGAPLSLTDVVERALCNNPQTREAWANALYQAAQVGIGQSAYLPTLNLNASETRNRSDGGGNAGRTYSQLSAALSLSYVLYDFGARDASLENAKQVLNALNSTQDATIQSVFLAAVQAYYQFFATQAAVDSARQAEKSAQESYKAAVARYNVGSATPADKLQAQTALSQAVLNRIRAEGDYGNAQGILANSMGLDADRSISLTPPAPGVPDEKFERDIAGLIEAARRQRPDLAAAEAQVKAAQAGAQAARAAGMPSIALAANLNSTHSGISDPFNSAALGVSVSIPLFSGYNTTYRVRAAEAQIETRRAQRERISQQVALDVWKAYQGVVTETQAAKSASDLEASAAQSESVALGRYKAGVGSLLDLLTAQSALASARVQNIQATYNWHIAKATLAQSMGRLDFSALETPAPPKSNP